MNSLSIELANGHTIFKPEEPLVGVAKWHLDKPQDWLEVRLIWFTKGKGTQDVGMIDKLTIESPSMAGSRNFEFKLPIGPHSFSGRLISLIWTVEFVMKRGDDSARAEFVLSPYLAEIDLTAGAK